MGHIPLFFFFKSDLPSGSLFVSTLNPNGSQEFPNICCIPPTIPARFLRLTTFLALKPGAKLIVQPVILGPVAILDLFKFK